MWHSHLLCSYHSSRTFFHTHIWIAAAGLIHKIDRARIAWGCEMLVSMLFTLPAWQSSMSLQMFPESCKYLPRALMSADSISDHKDISVFLSVSVRCAVKRELSLPGTFTWSEGLNENITQGFGNNNNNNNFWKVIQIFLVTSYLAGLFFSPRHQLVSLCWKATQGRLHRFSRVWDHSWQNTLAENILMEVLGAPGNKCFVL